MNPDFNLQVQDALNRRVFLRNTTSFLGLSALAGLTQAKTSSSGLPGFPTHAARRSGSFICSNPGHRRRWICLIPNRRLPIGAARICPTLSGKVSGSPR